MFKDKLKQLRIARNLTQADIAKALGVSPATIGNYEQGTREPRNNEMWKKLADFFGVSVNDLMNNDDIQYIIKFGNPGESSEKDWTRQFRTDTRIIYNDVDITPLVNANYNERTPVTKNQRFAYAEYTSRSGHVLYARRRLLEILNELHSKTNKEISEDLHGIINNIENNVVYWYKRCWCDIDDLFPAADSLETLYDLLSKCLSVDMIAQQEFTLIPIDENFDWLREKLR
ncbi:XRE family transcriptional regulator [bacterium D16-51]|nr:XRE family transcriptional regulator [bacterium D16-59]RKI54176.1 XRE family transcriptional regulator [bacterium D16-51]